MQYDLLVYNQTVKPSSDRWEGFTQLLLVMCSAVLDIVLFVEYVYFVVTWNTQYSTT